MQRYTKWQHRSINQCIWSRKKEPRIQIKLHVRRCNASNKPCRGRALTDMDHGFLQPEAQKNFALSLIVRAENYFGGKISSPAGGREERGGGGEQEEEQRNRNAFHGALHGGAYLCPVSCGMLCMRRCLKSFRFQTITSPVLSFFRLIFPGSGRPGN